MNPLVFNCTTAHILLRLLHSSLSVPFHHHLNGPYLLYSVVMAADEFIDKQVFPDHNSLFIDYVIELAFFLLDNILLVILLIVIIVVLLVIEVLLWLLLLCRLLLVSLVVELVQDVLDLSLELLITLLHQVLQDLWHAKLFRLFSQLFAGEDRVEGAVDVSSHLQIIMLYQIVENFQKLNLGILTFVLAGCPQRQVHQKSCCIFNTIVTKLISFVSENSGYPFYHV